MVKTVSPWTTEGCHECGEEFQLAHERSITIDENAVLLCESCETYAKGYQDGLAAHECKVQSDSAWGGQMQLKGKAIVLSYGEKGEPIAVRFVEEGNIRVVTPTTNEMIDPGMLCVIDEDGRATVDAETYVPPKESCLARLLPELKVYKVTGAVTVLVVGVDEGEAEETAFANSETIIEYNGLGWTAELIRDFSGCTEGEPYGGGWAPASTYRRNNLGEELTDEEE